MVRGEQLYHLKGAVTEKEREQRLGQYYTVVWQQQGLETQPNRIIMDYQQAATGSKVLHLSKNLSPNADQGKVEFNITGDSYQRGGRVLSWRVRLLKNSQVLAEERSYLWR